MSLLSGMIGSRSRDVGANGKFEQTKTLTKRMPYQKPTFTLDQIKQAVPSHCFHRSLFRSFSYVVYDLALSFLFYYIASSYIPSQSSPFTFLAWPIYWLLQGLTFTGLWVLAHECGHHAFSEYQWVDDTVGLILHSALLVPYFSWKYSHRRHHSNAGSLERDEVFVPKTKSRVSGYSKYLNNPLGRALTLSVKLVLGWPLYLAFNVSGRTYGGFASHFNPHGPIYSDRKRLQIYISDLGILATSYMLYRVAMAQGLTWLMCIYGMPLLIVNGCLVTIIYLQHNHPALPHFDSSEWDWLRGALSTVDRDYGVLNKVFHNMTDAHVAHHIFNTIPHYHAKEVTKAIKPILGDYYQFDGTPILKALWRETKECVYVEQDEGNQNQGIFWYGNKL